MTANEGTIVEAVPTVAETLPPELPYDPEAVILSVRDWIRKLAWDYAASRGRRDLRHDLECYLTAKVWDFLARGLYDPGRTRPTTYVSVVARSYLWRGLLETIGRAPVRSLEAIGDGMAGEIPDPGPDPAEVVAGRVDDGDNLARVRRVLAQLGERDREVVKRSCLRGHTLEAIGADLGVSRERVRQIRDAAIATVRAAIEDPESGPASGARAVRHRVTPRQFLAVAEAHGWDAVAAGRSLGIGGYPSYQRAWRLYRAGCWPEGRRPARPGKEVVS